jgi:hypothetical protein
MRPLVIGAAQKEQIAKLRALAAANVMDPGDMQKAAEKDISAFRKMMVEFSIGLPVGFLVTYCHERQPDPLGVVAHISVTVDRFNRTPHPAAVDMILDAFGMQPINQSVKVWIEEVAPGENAINIVQRLR